MAGGERAGVLAVVSWAAEQVIAKAACASDANRFGTARQLREAHAAAKELRDAVAEEKEREEELQTAKNQSYDPKEPDGAYLFHERIRIASRNLNQANRRVRAALRRFDGGSDDGR